jgi:branched-chain amino acid transport system substrate-binding protein
MDRRTILKLGATAAVLPAALARPAIAQGGPMLRLGVLNDQSGLYADLTGQGSVVATRMAIEDFKAAEKGIRVEVIAADHQNKPDVGSNIARQWFDRDGVDVILDVPTSSVALAVASVTKERDKVFLNSGAATADLTGPACTPNTIHWSYDTWMLANGTGKSMVAAGGRTWYFITADYAFGHALERDTMAKVKEGGGQVLGAVRTPFPGTTDFSSFLVQAQASRAQVIGLANAGGDTINSIKQAAEFGLTRRGTKLAALLFQVTDVHALGLQTAQGLNLTESFYWDLNDGTRAFANRFHPQFRGIRPTQIHAGCYSSTLHYLKTVEAMGGVEAAKRSGAATVARMKEIKTSDPLFGEGEVRADGRKIHPVYLFEVKKPEESKGPWDYYKLVRTIPAAESFRPIAEGGCPLVRS